MKIVKRILLGLLGLVVLLLIIALFIKKDYTVERTVIINKPTSEVFDYIKYLKNQNDYSKWNLMDPNMKKMYSGTDATPGFIAAWDGNGKVGKGEQEIKKITEGERIDYEIRFKKTMGIHSAGIHEHRQQRRRSNYRQVELCGHHALPDECDAAVYEHG